MNQFDRSCLILSVVSKCQTVRPLLFDSIHMYAPQYSFIIISSFLSINVLSCLFNTSCTQPHRSTLTTHHTAPLTLHSYHIHTTLHATPLTLTLRQTLLCTPLHSHSHYTGPLLIGCNACRGSPNSAPSAINVGATDIEDKVSYFSDIGTYVLT